MMYRRALNSVVLCLAVVVCWSTLAPADQGHPVAIRHLPEGGFAIESMWNLSVVVGASDVAEGALLEVGKSQSEGNDFGRFTVLVDAQGNGEVDHVLDRLANQDKANWMPWDQATKYSGNAIRVRSFASSAAVVIDVDGVRIAYLPDVATRIDEKSREAMAASDVLISGSDTLDSRGEAEELAGELGARLLVLIAGDPSTGNTVAIRSLKSDTTNKLRTVILSDKPTELSQELTSFMNKKEEACRASQKVFAKLSVKQMNFRPGNGSHTPRWNAEHMMGRELGFFSQIFAKQDPSIPVMDLNPKQMPPDYVARHVDWSGEEEARQMERVSAFTRRFAYLLKDLPLDEKAPGSGWTPRALLRQMDRHYSEHTANVVKKFELENWPKD